MDDYISFSKSQMKSYVLNQRYKNILTYLDPSCLTKISNFNKAKRPYIIGFTGASSSGKTYLAKLLTSILSENFDVAYFSQDNYYRCFKTDFENLYSLSEFYNTINFDDPNHFRFNKLQSDLLQIKKTKFQNTFNLPKITFGTSTHFPFIEEEALPIKVSPIIITEGVYALTNPKVNEVYDLTFFVDMDDNIRKEVWTNRNTKEGRFFNEAMWETTVESLNSHILPSRNHANIILNNTNLSNNCEAFFKDLFLNPFM